MKASECGFANPPADGTYEAETIDRFRDFLRIQGPPPAKGEHRHMSAARRYALRLAAWRLGPESINLAARLNGTDEWWPA